MLTYQFIVLPNHMSNPMSIFFDFKNVLSLFRIACLMHFSLLIHFFVKLAINVRLDAQLFIVRYLQRYSVVFLILFLYLHYHCSLVLLRIKDLFIIDWFIDRFIDRLIDRLINWFIDWLLDWFIGWLICLWQKWRRWLMTVLRIKTTLQCMTSRHVTLTNCHSKPASMSW